MKAQRGILLLVVLAAFATVSLVVVQYASAQKLVDKPVKLKAASTVSSPDVGMMAEVFKSWQDEVTKRTNGAITFETYWGASLDAPVAHIELGKKGTVNVVQTFHWYTPTKFPIADFEYAIPFGPTDYVLVTKALRKIRAEFPEFAKDDARENVIMIADPVGGVYNFLSNKPLRTIDDFKGEKVSLVGRYFGRWLPPGATAIVRPMHDRYDLLRTGVVKVDLLPFEHFYALRIYEVTKYYINARILAASYSPILMNLDTFKGFSPEIQKIFLEAGQEVEMRSAKEIVPKWWDRCEKEFKSKKLTIIDFPQGRDTKMGSNGRGYPWGMGDRSGG